MDTLTIIFAGLIAHVLTAGGIQRAVIVAAPNHTARLMLRSSDIVSESDPPLAEDAGAPAGERWFGIAGLAIKLGGLPAGTPIVDSSFAEHVVPLSMISDATEIRSEVESGRLFSGAVAYIDLPAGLMSAPDLYPQEVTFAGSQWPGAKCLAQHVVFTSGAVESSQIQVRASTGATVTLRAGAILRVENEPTSSMDPHFNLYQQLLVEGTTFVLPLRTGNSCTSDLTIASASARNAVAAAHLHTRPLGVEALDIGSPECTNTRFP
jgi:hypothetical protein